MQFWQNHRLAHPPGGLGPSPTGNPGFAPESRTELQEKALSKIQKQTHHSLFKYLYNCWSVCAGVGFVKLSTH